MKAVMQNPFMQLQHTKKEGSSLLVLFLSLLQRKPQAVCSFAETI
jgi:hypothetical protein